MIEQISFLLLMYTATIPSNAQRLAVVNAAYIPAWLISPVLTVVSAPVEVPVESSGFSAGFSLSDGFPSTYSGFWLFSPSHVISKL